MWKSGSQVEAAGSPLAHVCVPHQVTWLTWAHAAFGSSELRVETPPGPMLSSGQVGTRTLTLRQAPARSPCPPRVPGWTWPSGPGGHLLMHAPSLAWLLPRSVSQHARSHCPDALLAPSPCLRAAPPWRSQNVTPPHPQGHAKGTASPSSLLTSSCAVSILGSL